MTRRLLSWLSNHQVLAISTLNAALILCLAVVIGLGTTRNNSKHLVWALDTSTEAQPTRKIDRSDSGRQPPRETPARPESPPLPEKTPAHQEPPEEPALKPVELVVPPVTSPLPGASIPVETAVEKLKEPADAVEKAPDLKPAEKKEGFPARRSPPGRNVRALRARPVPPTQRGRILRPRQ